jgi:hypothetical protein
MLVQANDDPILIEVRDLLVGLTFRARQVDALLVQEGHSLRVCGFLFQSPTGEHERGPIERVANRLRNQAGGTVFVVDEQDAMHVASGISDLLIGIQIQYLLADTQCLIGDATEEVEYVPHRDRNFEWDLAFASQPPEFLA